MGGGKESPKEVLDKSQAEYWFTQIPMYWGLPNELFTEEVEDREPMKKSERTYKSLMLSNHHTISDVYNSLLLQKDVWQTDQKNHAVFLSKILPTDFSKISFKDNMILLAKGAIKNGVNIKVKTATDVLCLSAALSDGDSSLKTKVKFKSFNRSERKALLDKLNSSRNLEEDVPRRQGEFKKLFHDLHPGNYRQFGTVSKVYNRLYNDKVKLFSSIVEAGIKKKDPKVLMALKPRPGESLKSVFKTLRVFGKTAESSFIKVLPKLTVRQLVSIQKVLINNNVMKRRVFTPKGNFAKMQLGLPEEINQSHIDNICKLIDK